MHRTKPLHLLDTPTRQVQDLGIKNQTLTSAWQPLYFESSFLLLVIESYTYFFSKMLRGRGAEMYIENNRGRLAEESSSCDRAKGNLEYAQYSVGGRILTLTCLPSLDTLSLHTHLTAPSNTSIHSHSTLIPTAALRLSAVY